ncbi:MAG: helix-turn-helix domain-containing protein [Prevotellaceae bacterium]|jgi:transcriptional regulator with XRE-family HTH domain|nr:helix-turn-helix domain-containing protein [Prevotellaceae bacterium]
MDLYQIGKNIRVTRVSRGLNQENIATELGISITAYSKIERGKTNPSILRLDQIAKCLGVSVFDFLSGPDAVPAPEKGGTSSSLEVEYLLLKREVAHLKDAIENKNEIIRLLKKEF